MPEKIIEKIVSAPAQALEQTLQTTSELAQKLVDNKPVNKARGYWATLGPGLTTGAADDDPSGIATYSQTGAQYSFNLLWLAAFSFPLMAMVQEMCARIGLVTGRGLAGNIRRLFPKSVLYIITMLLLAANTFNIGADLGAMASATNLLIPNLGFASLVIFFTVVSLGLQIFTTYAQYAKYLKWLALALLAYIASAFMVNLNGKELLLNTVIPHLNFSRDEIFLVCGILGTTISPYLFFWQTSQEVEEEILAGKTSLKLRQTQTTDVEISKMRTDVWSGMFFSNLVMFFIIVTCAATLNKAGITNVQTAAEAAAALRPLAGPYASLLFALGVIGIGLLAVPVLAGSTAYAMSEAFGWRHGLYRKLKNAYPFYGVIIISMALGLIMNFVGLDPIKALIYAAVLNGLVAPIILVFVVKISSDKKVMNHRVNKPWTQAFGWIITGLMILVGVATLAILIVPK